MGTFHSNKGDLHGITVVVETRGTQVYVGRCDTQTPEGILLLDCDEHDESSSETPRQEYLQKVVKFGHWKKHDRLFVANDDIASVQRLGELSV